MNIHSTKKLKIIGGLDCRYSFELKSKGTNFLRGKLDVNNSALFSKIVVGAASHSFSFKLPLELGGGSSELEPVAEGGLVLSLLMVRW